MLQLNFAFALYFSEIEFRLSILFQIVNNDLNKMILSGVKHKVTGCTDKMSHLYLSSKYIAFHLYFVEMSFVKHKLLQVSVWQALAWDMYVVHLYISKWYIISAGAGFQPKVQGLPVSNPF